MIDWNVYPNSRISRIKSPFIRACALYFRHVLLMINGTYDQRIRNPYYFWLERYEYAKAIDLAMFYIRRAAVEGDIAEFGTHGVTAKVIAQQMNFYKTKNNIHLFDSFEGFPEPKASEDVNCPHVKTNAWRTRGSAGPESVLKIRQSLEKKIVPQQIKIYKGYYDTTLGDIPVGTQFAMVLLDCCLYLSHYQALDHCFGHNIISEGAILLFSDYNANKASPLYGSRKAWAEIVVKYNINHSNAGTYCWGGQKFIIHSYLKKG